MALVISDANVLIDIEIGQLTASMFALPFDIAVPDVLYAQELSDRHSHLLKMGLQVKSVNEEHLGKILFWADKYRRVSRMDLFALGLALQEKAQSLTGDKELRKVALLSEVQVHGTIWLVEQMLEEKIIELGMVEIAFARMKEQGSRLPWNEIGQKFAAKAIRFS